MNSQLDQYDLLAKRLRNLLNSIFQKPNSITQLIEKILIFTFVIFLLLVMLAFAGLLENPIGL